MAEPLSSLIRPHRGPVLPALERLAPPPPESLAGTEIEARTAPGDVVVDLHGRGAWVARAAVNRLRRVYDLESTALTRFVSELVLRPPDLRHFDAALNALAVHPRGDVGLRQSVMAPFASRCANCGRNVMVEEFIWDGDAAAPSRKSYRCAACRAGDGRPVPTDAEDAERAQATRDLSARAALMGRFPTPEPGHALPTQLLDLYTPRTLNALAAIIERIESDLRAPSIQAALRLAVVHLVLPASRLNSYPGRVAALRVSNGRVKPLGERQWRERNPWLLFEEGCRMVRAFVQRIEGAPSGPIQARFGNDLATLLDGSANVVLRQGSAASRDAGLRLPADRTEHAGRLEPRSRIRLVLTQPPTHWTPENLSFAYLASCLALGRQAAETLPLEAVFGPPPRGEWVWDAAALRRSMAGVLPVLAPDARVVLMLDRTGPGGLVAGVLGGVGAGYRLDGALLAESGEEIGGTLEFAPPGSTPPDDRTLPDLPANVDPDEPFELAAVEAAVTDVAVAVLQARGEPCRFERLLGEVLIGLDRMGHLRRLIGTETYTETEQRAEAEAEAVGLFNAPTVDVPMDTASGNGSAPGHAEPAAMPSEDPASAPRPPSVRSWRDPFRQVRAPMAVRLDDPARTAEAEAAASASVALGELVDVVDVDASADLTPEAGQALAPEADQAIEPDAELAQEAEPAATDGHEPRSAPEPEVVEPPDPFAASEPVAAWQTSGAGSDPVRLMLEIVMDELRRTDHPRLLELEPKRWWLRESSDIAAARPPLSDRLEWSVFSLLSTSGGIGEAAFFDRVAGMFRGHDTPDEELVRACLESYRTREPAPDGLLHTADSLRERYEEHGTLVGMLAEYGHRMGLRVWISGREQRRTFKGAPLGDLLSEAERRVYLPLVSAGDPDALEATDCIWYLRGKATFLFEVEWTAMLDEPILRRGTRIPAGDTLVRFLVIPPERSELVRLKLTRSPLLRRRMEEDNWHILKTDHVRRLYGHEEADLESLAPLLGLDPEVERQGEQLPLFA